MLHSKLFDGLKRISTPFRTRNPHRDGARRQCGFRRPRLECLERRELLSLTGWSLARGGPESDTGLETAVDTAGNVYVTGTFSGEVDFDPGLDVVNLTSEYTLLELFSRTGHTQEPLTVGDHVEPVLLCKLPA